MIQFLSTETSASTMELIVSLLPMILIPVIAAANIALTALAVRGAFLLFV